MSHFSIEVKLRLSRSAAVKNKVKTRPKKEPTRRLQYDADAVDFPKIA